MVKGWRVEVNHFFVFYDMLSFLSIEESRRRWIYIEYYSETSSRNISTMRGWIGILPFRTLYFTI